jgi:hypothetical protein
VSSPIPATASAYPISTPGGGYPQAGPNGVGNGSNGYSQPAPLTPPTPVAATPPRVEPEGDWLHGRGESQERPVEREEPQVPPRVVELPDAARPARPSRPVVLEDDDLDVPDFLK